MDYKLISNTRGDWEGLYVNDKLEMQCHSIQLGEVLQFQLRTGLYPTSFTFYEEVGEWVEDIGEFPINFNDCGETRKYETCN